MANRLLVDGDPVPLLRFGATSGKGIAFGLALFGVNADSAPSEERIVRFDEFELVIGAPVPPAVDARPEDRAVRQVVVVQLAKTSKLKGAGATMDSPNPRCAVGFRSPSVFSADEGSAFARMAQLR